MDTFENPYCSIAELRRELRNQSTTDPTDADLQHAIWEASRWIDNYKGRNFFLNDYSQDPLVLDQFSRGVFNSSIYPLFNRIISVSSVEKGDVALTLNTDYVVTEESIESLAGKWAPIRPGGLVEIFGRFGYMQPLVWSVVEVGDVLDQVSDWELNDLDEDATYYWTLTDEGGGTVRVDIYEDVGHTTLLARGTGGAGSRITLAEQNDSGISGAVAVIGGAFTDDDASNTLTPDAYEIDRTAVPIGIPGHINLACIRVAAVMSGHDRKEVAGLDGNRVEILTNVIPKTVLDMLGPPKPVWWR